LPCVLAARFSIGSEPKGASGFAVSSIEETKAIAKEDFIHGLPIVNYGMTYQFAVGRAGS
jgi:hypothetical protein